MIEFSEEEEEEIPFRFEEERIPPSSLFLADNYACITSFLIFLLSSFSFQLEILGRKLT